MKSLAFTSSENVFISPSFLKNIFMGYRILTVLFFLASMVAERNVPLSLAAFKISSSPFLFSLIMLGFIWIYPV